MYTIRNVSAPELTREDVEANAHAYAGDHVAACVDRMQDAIDYRAMLARTRTQQKIREALRRDIARGSDTTLLAPRPQAGGATMPIFPRGFVRLELDTGHTFRERHEDGQLEGR